MRLLIENNRAARTKHFPVTWINSWLLCATDGYSATKNQRLQSTIIEPLSERELEVLRLLGTELSGPELPAN